MAKQEINELLDKLNKNRVENKRRKALADQHFIFVILMERDIFAAAEAAIKRESTSEHFVLIGT